MGKSLPIILALSISIFLVSVRNSFALTDVVINEFSARPESNGSDWVEIYNNTLQTINIDGWVIRDSTDTNKIDLSGSICPTNHRKFDFSNRLNNDGDSIKLLDSESSTSPMDEITYFTDSIPEHQIGQSTGREPQGSSTWQVFTSPTPNNDESCNPSPSPSPSPSPTATPASQSSSTKKASPTPKTSATPKSTPAPTASETASPEVLGSTDISQSIANTDPFSSPKPAGFSFTSKPSGKVASIMIGAGSLFIAVSAGVYYFYKKKLEKEGLSQNPAQDET